MGHERLGFLPKTQRWRNIVDQIGTYTFDNNIIQELSEKVIRNVRKNIENIENDKGVKSSLKFLIYLSYASKQDNPTKYLASKDITISGETLTPLRIAKAYYNWLNKNMDSNEYGSFAKSATVETITEWYNSHRTSQEELFKIQNNESIAIWRNASNGAGFCELSRIFFARFTEKYLKYFLEREASSKIINLSDRIHFNKSIKEHVDAISIHAFEITKIAESYSAGWFNKYAIDDFPSDDDINGFLKYSFNKIQAELLREEPFNA